MSCQHPNMRAPAVVSQVPCTCSGKRQPTCLANLQKIDCRPVPWSSTVKLCVRVSLPACACDETARGYSCLGLLQAPDNVLVFPRLVGSLLIIEFVAICQRFQSLPLSTNHALHQTALHGTPKTSTDIACYAFTFAAIYDITMTAISRSCAPRHFSTTLGNLTLNI